MRKIIAVLIRWWGLMLIGQGYALASIEDDIIKQLEVGIHEEFADNAKVQVLMFDGLVVQLPEGQANRLEGVLASVGERNGVTFTSKKL